MRQQAAGGLLSSLHAAMQLGHLALSKEDWLLHSGLSADALCDRE
jgi:hypothetical protein